MREFQPPAWNITMHSDAKNILTNGEIFDPVFNINDIPSIGQKHHIAYSYRVRSGTENRIAS